MTKKHTMTPLSLDFNPSLNDVICSRGKTAFEHNKNFQDLCRQYLDGYSNANTKLDKSLIVSKIIQTVKDQTLGGFVRKVDGVWYRVSDSIAREKIGGAFREMLHTQYQSSSKSKKRRQQQIQQQQDQAKYTPEITHSKNIPLLVEFMPVAKRRRTTVSIDKDFQQSKLDLTFLLDDILSDNTVLPPLTSSLKQPTIPKPSKFPCPLSPRSVQHGCSIESIQSFDIPSSDNKENLLRFNSIESYNPCFVW